MSSGRRGRAGIAALDTAEWSVDIGGTGHYKIRHIPCGRLAGTTASSGTKNADNWVRITTRRHLRQCPALTEETPSR